MFDLFSSTHIIILLAAALIVVGPKDLPRLMHMIGKWAGKARGLASEFKKSFDDMARQSELDELRKEIENLRNNQTIAGVESDLNKPLESAAQTAAPDTGPEPRAGELKVTGTESAATPVITEAPAMAETPVMAETHRP